jgi:hypothetical protein
MQFETSFANKKSAIETVTFMQEKDGQWKSAGYFINPYFPNKLHKQELVTYNKAA